ncbi:MAG: type 1 glutamine amidotransferase domain-containing protein [Planctomycetota bacterium]
MKLLIVLTSHDQLGDTGRATGFWLEEFASPYYAFKQAGASVTLASPLGGQPPVDAMSTQPEFQSDETRRFEADADAQRELAGTAKLAEMKAADFDGVFYPGGYGPVWDLHSDEDSIALLEAFVYAAKPVATVCHGPAVLLKVKNPDGTPHVQGKRVTGYSNSEEAAAGLTEVVPYLIEDQLTALGAQYEKTDDWHPHIVVDDRLITGQNPASSSAVASALIEALK